MLKRYQDWNCYGFLLPGAKLTQECQDTFSDLSFLTDKLLSPKYLMEYCGNPTNAAKILSSISISLLSSGKQIYLWTDKSEGLHICLFNQICRNSPTVCESWCGFFPPLSPISLTFCVDTWMLVPTYRHARWSLQNEGPRRKDHVVFSALWRHQQMAWVPALAVGINVTF